MKPSRPNRINGANNGQINSGRRPILSSSRLLNSTEAKAFNQPIKSFWQDIDADPSLVTVPKLLSVERSAILAIGVERDLEKLIICRRKMLEFLKPGDRADYVDFLLTLSNQYFRKEEHLKARNILEQVVFVERENWHALKELAINLGIQGNVSEAVLRFEQAGNILEKYQQKGFEIAEAERMEAQTYEARFRTVLLVNQDQTTAKEKIFSILEPIFSLSQELDQEFYASQLAKILGAFLKIRVPTETLAYVFGKKVPGGIEGEFPVRLRLVLDHLLKGEKRVVKAFLKEIRRQKLVSGQASKKMSKYVGGVLQESDQEGVSIGAISLLDRIEKGEIDLAQNYRALAKETEKAYGEINAEEKEILRDEVVSMLRERINNPSLLNGAILFASELWEIDREFQQALNTLFETAFEQESFKESISKVVDQIRREVMLEAQKRTESGSKNVQPPATREFRTNETIHDFFFAKLRDLKAVKEIFAAIEQVYAEPVRLCSSWYGMLATLISDSPRKAKLLRSSLQEDENNIISRIVLARCLGKIGRLKDLDRVIQEMLNGSWHPLASLRGYVLQTAKNTMLAEKLIKQQGNREAAQELVKETRKIYEEAQKLIIQCESKYSDQKHFQKDRIAMAHNLAYLYSLIHGFEEAQRFFDLTLDLDPNHTSSLKGKGYLFLLQGKFYDACQYYAREIKESPIPEQVVAYYNYIAEAFLQVTEFEKALNSIEHALTYAPNHYNLHLTKARILLSADRVEETKEIIQKIAPGAKKISKIHPADKRNKEGMIKLLEAEILVKESRGNKALRKKTLAAFHQAIQFFSKGFYSEYYEMDARCSLVDTLSAWAAEDRDEKGFGDALKEGNILLQKYPFFVLAHQVIVAPLASLNRDREALEHIRWLIESNIVYLTLNVLANLILLASVDNEAQADARELLFSLEGKLTKGLVEEAVGMVTKFNPSVEVIEGLSALYEEES